jgi:hypothetical protein
MRAFRNCGGAPERTPFGSGALNELLVRDVGAKDAITVPSFARTDAPDIMMVPDTVATETRLVFGRIVEM